MDPKPGDQVIVRWPPGTDKRRRATVLEDPSPGRDRFRIQFENGGAKQYLSRTEFEAAFVETIELKLSLATALAAAMPKPSVPADVGSKVTVQKPDGSKKTYLLVPPGQGNQANSELGTDVPLGKALMGTVKGDTVEVNDSPFKILDVEPPARSPIAEPTKKAIRSVAALKLDEDKAAIIFGELKSNNVVMAPPGTGKSFTLAHRAALFIEKMNLSPREILILSFSREAVAEVKRRLRQFDIHNVNLIQPFTIDSFAATVLLSQAAKHHFETYEKSIVDATRILSAETLSGYRHIFVDEFQDIVGIRADFVQKILELKPAGCGATLLGDLEQSIYHWSLQGQPSQTRSDQFLFNVQKILGTGEQLKYLTRNFRVSNQSLKDTVNDFRGFLETTLAQSSVDLAAARATLDAKVRSLTPVTSSGAAKYSGELRPESGIRKCVLFRDNGQLIAETAVAHSVKIKPLVLGKYHRGLMPDWYACFLKAFHRRGEHIEKPHFEEWINGTQQSGGWDAHDAWTLLKSIEGLPENARYLSSVVLRRKIQYIREVPMPEREQRELTSSALTFSTYHASKGLEFDMVFLVEPEFRERDGYSDFRDEARMFYVGLTRARENVRLLPRTGVASLRSRSYPIGQVEERRWYRDEGDARLLNVDNESDVDSSSFIIPYGLCDVEKVQALLEKDVKEGDEVCLKLLEPAGFYKNYFIHWRGHALGAMSKFFYDSVVLLYGGAPPREINARIGRKYSEFRNTAYGYFPVDKTFANEIESWLALKLGGLARASR